VPDTNPEPTEGHDFKEELGVLHRVVACAGTAPLPKNLDASVVDKHCARVEPIVRLYREKYLAKAKPFFDGIRPKQLPPTVVYPFGGGDLLSPLLVFPDAREITTISLEYAGDPRVVSRSDKKTLDAGLALFADSFRTLLRGDWNWTRNMEALQKAKFPEQLGYALIALAVHEYQPLSLRYFRLKSDGAIDYLDDAEIEALADKRPEQLRVWGAPDYSLAFSNAEIRFAKPGGGPVKVYRHMAGNLSNKGLREDIPELLRHLEKKGMISATTRAASHLLWSPYFTDMRDFLTKHLVWMPSDSTGITPEDAKAAGLVQEFYGTFEGMYEPSDQDPRPKVHSETLKVLFKEKSTTQLDFLYGYSDNRRVDAATQRIGHVIVTRKP
jgi:hypothetical protein